MGLFKKYNPKIIHFYQKYKAKIDYFCRKYGAKNKYKAKNASFGQKYGAKTSQAQKSTPTVRSTTCLPISRFGLSKAANYRVFLA
ncbi:MAG: hypothetical protein FWB85_09310 [Chitinispirillia bacterium]|nr:hypothetical protein [Chitinispirillia bacterium]